MLKKMNPSYTRNHVKGLSFNGFHQVSYLEWGAEHGNDDTLVCVHGVSRNSHDFDFLAKRFSKNHRVICPDVVGRGESDYLPDSDSYNYLQYNSDMNVLLSRLHTPHVDWLGTSMGGIIGMVLASLAQTPIRRLILNDIGPFISRDCLTEMGKYIGRSGEFGTQKQIKNYLQNIYTEFHPMSEDDWDEMVEHSSERTSHGKYRLKLDPGVGDSFRDNISLFDIDMWDTWDKIHCPVLILRGKESTFFSKKTAQEMLTRGPNATLVEVEKSGHTPTLRNDEQVDIIENWLKETPV